MTYSAAVIARKKRRRRRRRAVRRMIYMAGLMAVIVTALRTASHYLLKNSGGESIVEKQERYVQPVAAVDVKQPARRQASQIIQDLEQYAQTSKAAAQIYKDSGKYPETLLGAYLNNPEMEDFVLGYLEADSPQPASSGGSLTQQEAQQRYPLLLQWDKRWGYVSYGGSIIGLSGCGPTCLSMAAVTLTGDAQLTPAEVAQFSESCGYYVEGSGTSWSLMTEGAARLGLSARELSLDEDVMKAALDAGQPIICSMGAGDFTAEGHFILIYSYDADGFLVNDPNCIARSGRTWTFEQLRGQIKNLWGYSKQ